MARKNVNTVTLYLSPDEVTRLQEIAAHLGFYQTRGNLQLPNLSALCRAIVSLPPEKWPELKGILEAAE